MLGSLESNTTQNRISHFLVSPFIHGAKNICAFKTGKIGNQPLTLIQRILRLVIGIFQMIPGINYFSLVMDKLLTSKKIQPFLSLESNEKKKSLDSVEKTEKEKIVEKEVIPLSANEKELDDAMLDLILDQNEFKKKECLKDTTTLKNEDNLSLNLGLVDEVEECAKDEIEEKSIDFAAQSSLIDETEFEEDRTDEVKIGEILMKESTFSSK